MTPIQKIALLLLAGAVVLVALSLDLALHSTRRIFLFGAVVLAVLCVTAVMPELRHGPAALFSAKLFGIAGIVVFLLMGMLKSVFIYDAPVTVDPWTAVRAVLLVASGILGLWIGSLLAIRPRRLGPFSRGQVSGTRLLVFTLLLASVGAPAAVLFYNPFLPFDPTISNYLRVFSGCLAPAGALAVWQLFMSRPRTPARRWLLVAVLLPLPVVGIVSTSRVPLAFIVSFAFVVYVYRTWNRHPDRFPYGRVAILATGMVLFMFASAAVVDVLADKHWAIGDEGDVVVGTAQARFYSLTSIDAFDNLVRTIELYPDQGRYLYGWSVAAVIVNPIPRSMWPEKPYGYARLLAEETDARYFEGMSLSPSLAGEMVANFGFLGPFLGYLAMGSVAATLYQRYLRARASSPYHVLYLAGLVLFLLESRGDLLSITVRLGWYLFCLYVALRLSTIDSPASCEPRGRHVWLPAPARL
jgi:hypothetical protein